MNEPHQAEPHQAPSTRWLQYSVKSVLILMLVIAAYFAGLATMLRRAERAERKLSEHLTAAKRSDVELQVAAAKAEVAVLRDRLASTERLFKRGYVSNLQLQSAKLQLQTGEVKLAKAKAMLLAVNNETMEQ